MKNNISIIGGDLRTSKLAEMMSQDGNQIYVYGMEKSSDIEENQKIIKCKNMEEAIDSSNVIIGSIPFSKNEEETYAVFSDKHIKINDFTKENYENKVFIAGSIPKKTEDKLHESYKTVVDIMKREELAILNTIATAEGAIEVAIKNTDTILHGSNVLILGFGRVAKVTAEKFNGLSAKITCAARKLSDLAWMKTLGYKSLDINSLGENLHDFDIIINTVPSMIINKKEMEYMKEDVLLIDLASKPGGINQDDAKELNLKLVWALALPGKVAPVTSASFIKESVYNIINEAL